MRTPLSIFALTIIVTARWGLMLQLYVLAAPAPPSPLRLLPNARPFDINDGSISEGTYSELEWFAKYSSAVYQFICPRPLGNTLVLPFSSPATHMQGFVARDDNRREIIVAFRGSRELSDMVIDGNLVLVPLISHGIRNHRASVHAGFLVAYNSVHHAVLRIVRRQLEKFPGYAVVTTGHSMGGAVASIAAWSIKSKFPSVTVRSFTFGQPRTGDTAYADLLEAAVGRENIFRSVHTWDGVPTMIPKSIGYHHHATEYWQFQEPPNASTVRRCEGQEDIECSHSIPSTGVNPAHWVYFGQVMGMDAALCLG